MVDPGPSMVYHGRMDTTIFTAAVEERIRSAIAYECDRQHVGLDRREFLFAAYGEAWQLSHGSSAPTGEQALRLAGVLEPSNGGRVRSTPVTFRDGGSSASPSDVDRLYWTLFENLPPVGASEEEVAYWVREFLWVHPFSDGNGRAAWLLYNWLLGAWKEPLRLPYFFGEA